VAALLAMQIYIKRGMEGRLHQASDELGQQYSPQHTSSDMWVSNITITDTTVTTKKVPKDPKDPTNTEMIDKTTTVANTVLDEEMRFGTETTDKLDTESLF
jgi:hypothetical protein